MGAPADDNGVGSHGCRVDEGACDASVHRADNPVTNGPHVWKQNLQEALQQEAEQLRQALEHVAAQHACRQKQLVADFLHEVVGSTGGATELLGDGSDEEDVEPMALRQGSAHTLGVQACERNQRFAKPHLAVSTEAYPLSGTRITQMCDYTPTMEFLVRTAPRDPTLAGLPRRHHRRVPLCAWLFNACSTIREPRRTGRLARVAASKYFEMLCMLVIAINGIVIISTTNYEAAHLGEAMPGSLAMDTVFVSFYVFECCLKLAVHRLYLFCNTDMWWNIFDLMLALIATMDLLLEHFKTQDMALNITFLRTLRVAKVSKVLRMVRVFQFVAQLRLMIDAVIGSLVSLLWCLVFLAFMIALFALFFVQASTEFLAGDSSIDSAAQSEMQFFFGSVQGAMLTLFQSTSNGQDWSLAYSKAIETSSISGVVYIGFIIFFTVAAWNIVTSLFVEKTIDLANRDTARMMLEKQRQDLHDVRQLEMLMETMDVDNDGLISEDEFRKFLDNPRLESYFELRGLHVKDAEMFYRMLAATATDDGVPLDTFVAGCMNMKGPASSVDVHSLTYGSRLMHEKNLQFFKYSVQQFGELKTALESILISSGAQSLSAGNSEPQRSSTSLGL